MRLVHTDTHTHTHTHTQRPDVRNHCVTHLPPHTQRERDRERERDTDTGAGAGKGARTGAGWINVRATFMPAAVQSSQANVVCSDSIGNAHYVLQ